LKTVTPSAAAATPDATPAAVRLQWRLQYWLYRIVETILGILPGAAVARIGRGAGWLAFKVLPIRRRIVERNLRIAFAGEKPAAEIKRMVRETFYRTGANMLSALRTARLSEAGVRKSVTFENPAAMDALAADPRGAAIILAHMGNWEALAQIFALTVPANKQPGTIYRFLKNPYMDAHLQRSRGRLGTVLFEKRSSPLTMAAFVRSGNWLGILSDQRVEQAGEIVPFFGRLTSCTPLPAILARRVHARVVGFSMKTVAPGRWSIKVHEAGAGETTEACMRLLEEVIRESPEDVFWLQDRWRVTARRALHINGRAPGAQGLADRTKPRRGLVWLLPDDTTAYEPESAYADTAWEHHRSPAQADVAALVRVLTEIDEARSLPLDFVVVSRTEKTLAKACAKLGLPLMIYSAGKNA
jgi:Kdo2-lipid IVA lauroyltransferase/acyltransferase